MITVTDQTQCTITKSGSKFDGYLFRVKSKQHFDRELENIRNTYLDATHHCYGWRINPHDITEFAKDDGEPSGTAGRPILNQLKSFDAINIACIVIRYYGGTKLGTSRLIECYGQVAKNCLQAANLQKVVTTRNFIINNPYSEEKHIRRLKQRFDTKEIDASYQK